MLWFVLAALGLALALLLKPFVVFLAPVYAAILWYNNQLNKKRLPTLIVFVVVAFLPLLWWRDWIVQFPEGIPNSDWLYNGNHIRFRPAWVRWLGYERLTKIMLGFAGIVFLPLGLFFKKIAKNKRKIVYWSWWLGIFGYLTVFATGNVQHDYYQNLLVPILCITVAEGVMAGYKILKDFCQLTLKFTSQTAHFLAIGAITTTYGVMLFFSWQAVKGYFNINFWERNKAGLVADQLLPPDAKVIAPDSGDTAFLFQTNRRGWPIGFDIEDKVAKGATHYVTTTFNDEANQLQSEYFIVAKTDEYLILDLRRRKETP